MDLAELSPEYDYSKFEDDGTGYGCAECDDYNYYMETSEDDDERHDEKLKSEVSGTRQLIFNDGDVRSSEKKMFEGDTQLMEAIRATEWDASEDEGDASEEDMSTDMKKKMQKRKSREDVVKSEQNFGVETAIGVKKQKECNIL
ncbi:hypothetical protein MKW94_028055 [Papaver nudicaule]|uniref:Uncharacterized protein n=1 Tax=Papaver nudicaule TaxID=74823 RepID=A0AA41SJF8_PAPNU|nr:hypothetical protein [Papaver nudicaule]